MLAPVRRAVSCWSFVKRDGPAWNVEPSASWTPTCAALFTVERMKAQPRDLTLSWLPCERGSSMPSDDDECGSSHKFSSVTVEHVSAVTVHTTRRGTESLHALPLLC